MAMMMAAARHVTTRLMATVRWATMMATA
jgi:hypothetical protein